MPNIGPMEMIIVLVIVLLVFGPKRLPGLGKQLGTGMREFKDSINGKDHDEEDERPRKRAERDRVVVETAALPVAETTPAPIVDEPVRERTAAL